MNYRKTFYKINLRFKNLVWINARLAWLSDVRQARRESLESLTLYTFSNVYRFAPTQALHI